MTALAWLIPAALSLGGLGLLAFLWSLKTGQYEDLEGAAWRALEDEEPDTPAGTGPAGTGPVRDGPARDAQVKEDKPAR